MKIECLKLKKLACEKFTRQLSLENIVLRKFISSPRPRLYAAKVPAVRLNV